MNSSEKKRSLWLFEEWQLEEQEAWLMDMASQGWHLQSIGAMATFHKGPQRKIRYRCEIANPDYLNEERQELYEAAGWEYVGNHNSVQVYRAPWDAAIPEIHTEPITQAHTFRHLFGRLGAGLGTLLVLLVVGFLMGTTYNDFWLELLLEADYVLLLAVICLAYVLYLNTVGIIHLLRLRRRLRQGNELDHQAPWKRARSRNIARFVALVLMLLLLVGDRVGGMVSATAMSNFPPIPESELPLARLTDVLDELGIDWQREDSMGASLRERAGGDVFNSFRTKRSWLVPEQAELRENLKIAGLAAAVPEEKLMQEAYFYRARTPGLARLLAERLLQVRPLTTLPRDADDDTRPTLVVDDNTYSLWRYDGDSFHEFILLQGDRVYRVIYWGELAAEGLLQRTIDKVGI